MIKRVIEEVTRSDKAIGELNGRWAALLKLFLSMFPIFVPIFAAWMGWISILAINNSRHRHPEINQAIQKVLDEYHRDFRYIDDRIDNLPNTDWKEKVKMLEEEVDRMDKNNTADHTVILIALEKIKSKLGIEK